MLPLPKLGDFQKVTQLSCVQRSSQAGSASPVKRCIPFLNISPDLLIHKRERRACTDGEVHVSTDYSIRTNVVVQ